MSLLKFNMKAFVVFALAIVAVAARTVEQVHPKDQPRSAQIGGRITNGYPAQEGSVPYIVGLEFDGFWCGGSIIAHEWILTAAHCADMWTTKMTIYYGTTSIANAQLKHTVSKDQLIVHPNWPADGNDIALIHTPYVNFTPTINKVKLPSKSDSANKYNGWWTMACGWGKTTINGDTDRLQCADFQVITNEECSKTYGDQPNGNLCVSTTNGKSICSGDSGGPLVLHNGGKLVGVSGFVNESTCQSGSPAGFTRVTSHLDWIREKSGVSYY